MSSKNLSILVGNVGNDPEIKHTQSDISVANFKLATSKKYTDKSGKTTETTQWHPIVIWGKLALIIEKYVKKGDKLYLEGEINYRTYDDKDGNKKYVTEIVCHEMIMLGGKKSDNKTENNSLGQTKEDDLGF